MITTLMNIVYKVMFALALLSLLIAVVNKFLEFFGWTLLWVTYPPGRILELSALLMIFVIALLLREIREQLKK